MLQRTIRDFTTSAAIWSIADTWGDEQGFTVVTTKAERRVYQKGPDFLGYPLIVDIQQMNNQVHLETWLKASLLDRTRALFLIPSEIGLDSGSGLRMVIARKTGRSLVNKLLDRLGQPPI